MTASPTQDHSTKTDKASQAPKPPHRLLFGDVMHKRLFPKVNAFLYRIYYLDLDLDTLDQAPITQEKFGAMSLYRKDHGALDGSDLAQWARDILTKHNITEANGSIRMICMPRIFGYVFNPVSFWLCHDKNGALRAVISEVNNTFGERHSYLCAHTDHRPITKNDVITAQKIFHVSPMMEREGHYEFRFADQPDKFGVWIDYFDAGGKKKLLTSLVGNYEDMSKRSLRKAFWRVPVVTFKTMALIHWQAVKILLKGIKYIAKPKQLDQRLSTSDNLQNRD
jgi:DUF1365 family protein